MSNKNISKAGIHINENVITSISGPISFHYLRPKNNAAFFPLTILFGDAHQSNENICMDCTCSKDKKSCCYKLSDYELLDLFDTLPTEDFPVDFYTETSFAGMNFGQTDLGQLTRTMMVNCYNKNIRGKDSNRCPTNNIRWQAGDIRMASDMVGRFKHLMTKKYEIARDISIKYKENAYIESHLLYIFFKNMSKTITEDDFKRTYFKSFENYKAFLLTLFDTDSTGVILNRERFATKLFGMMDRNNSGVIKQIEKQSIKELKNKDFWLQVYIDSLYNIENAYLINEFRSELFTNISSMTIESMQQLNFLDVIVFIASPLVDIYVLSRMLKQPVGGLRSSLSFCYFGDAHINNISRILVKFFDYEVVSSIDRRHIEGLNTKKPENLNTNKLVRCLQLPYINLSDDLSKHNKAVLEYRKITPIVQTIWSGEEGEEISRIIDLLETDVCNGIKSLINNHTVKNLVSYAVKENEKNKSDDLNILIHTYNEISTVTFLKILETVCKKEKINGKILKEQILSNLCLSNMLSSIYIAVTSELVS